MYVRKYYVCMYVPDDAVIIITHTYLPTNPLQVGEDIFALSSTDYPDLKITEKELKLSDQLFGLYTDVLDTLQVGR